KLLPLGFVSNSRSFLSKSVVEAAFFRFQCGFGVILEFWNCVSHRESYGTSTPACAHFLLCRPSGAPICVCVLPRAYALGYLCRAYGARISVAVNVSVEVYILATTTGLKSQ